MALCLVALVPAARGQTIVRDDIRSNVVWSLEHSPYRVDRDVTVSGGATLSIMPGTVVEFGYDNTIRAYDDARIVAEGALFRPASTAGSAPSIFTYEAGAPGHVELSGCRFEHVHVETSGSGVVVLEGNRFEGEAHVRIYSSRPVVIRDNEFASRKPIWAAIRLPRSTVSGNVFAFGSVLYQRHAQRVSANDTLRTYQGLPVYIDNDVTVTDGAELIVPRRTQIIQGHFDSFLVNGGAVLRASGVRFSPADDRSGGPSLIVSQGNGRGRAEISDSVFEQLYVEFAGGTGSVTDSDFLVDAGQPALRNIGAGTVEAQNNYWNGAAGPLHTENPDGDGALISGQVQFSPWRTEPGAGEAATAAVHPITRGEGITVDAVFPNPANETLCIRVNVPLPSSAAAFLYDPLGREIRHYELGNMGPATREVRLDVSGLASGIYVLKLTIGKHVAARPFIVAR